MRPRLPFPGGISRRHRRLFVPPGGEGAAGPGGPEGAEERAGPWGRAGQGCNRVNRARFGLGSGAGAARGPRRPFCHPAPAGSPPLAWTGNRRLCLPSFSPKPGHGAAVVLRDGAAVPLPAPLGPGLCPGGSCQCPLCAAPRALQQLPAFSPLSSPSCLSLPLRFFFSFFSAFSPLSSPS